MPLRHISLARRAEMEANTSKSVKKSTRAARWTEVNARDRSKVHNCPQGAAKRVSGPQPGKINIHIICHSHFDAGRLKNLEQYYWGSAASVTPASAQYAIDSVVESLRRDALRKFTIGEVGRVCDARPVT